MISILIPTYNYNVTPLVQELVKQCENANLDFEIICQDDCSKLFIEENSVINDYKNCRFENNNSNLGRTKTRQILSQKAQFDWLLFLDADVIPIDEKFIENYYPFVNNYNSVVIGGIKYEEQTISKSKILRYKYGKEREEIGFETRQQKPYNYVLSANILIRKSVFDKFNFTENSNLYGLDIYFAYQLFLNKIPINHIENSVYHQGIEENEVFLKKSLDAVITRKKYLADLKDIGQISSLLNHYLFLKKYKLITITKILFKSFEPILKKLILNKNPNLFSLDLYRLGYICTLN